MKHLKVVISLAVLFSIAQNGFAQYQTVNSSGLDIHFRIFGKGEPLLIIGGGPGDLSDRYLSLCEGLSKNQQCVLVDQRGTGKSMPAVPDSSTITIALTLSDFETVRKQLGFRQWSVLGFSYGGFLASNYAADYPGSVAKLILLGSTGLNTDVFGYFGDNIFSRLQETDREVYDYWNDSARNAEMPDRALVERIRAMMPGYFFDRKKALLVSRTMKDGDFNFGMGRWIWKDIGKRNLDLSLKESGFDKPVLILHGRQDPLGESIPQILSRYYKNTTLIFVEKCGHYSWIEQPEIVFNSVSKFLNK